MHSPEVRVKFERQVRQSVLVPAEHVKQRGLQGWHLGIEVASYQYPSAHGIELELGSQGGMFGEMGV